MSVVSSRVSSVSSILKSIGGKSQVAIQSSRATYFKPPKDIKTILYNFETGKGHKEYKELICVLRDAVIKDDDLAEFLANVRECVSLLNSTHKLFVEVLLKIKWTDKSPEVISNYKLFVEDLICMQTHHINTVIDHLVEIFKPEKVDTEHTQEIEELKIEDIERLNHVHDILRKLLKVMPMSNKLLLQFLTSKFPYIGLGTYTHTIYVYVLLQVIDYAPQLRSDILCLIINKLTVLDVNIPREEANDDEEDDPMDSNISCDAISDNGSTAVDEASETKTVHPIARTLDACMELLFKYMHDLCYVGGVLQEQALTVLYFDVLKAFETVILPTHGSQYVQYIMIYVCSFKIDVTKRFVEWLWCQVSNRNVPEVTRQSAVYYISSLFATALFIPLGYVKSVIFRMVEWIHNYIAKQEYSDEYVSDNTKIHRVFYSICQAFFYLFITRHKELVNTKSNILFLQRLNIPTIIACRLNPLKVCSNEVVHIFADITKMYQLAYCNAIIESNVRNLLPVLGEEVHSSLSIPNSFPFESYTLQQSGQRIVTLVQSNVLDINSYSSKGHK